MTSESASAAPSELRAQRKLALTVAGLTLVLAFAFRNERELVMPAASIAETEASAFAATVATPSTLSGIGTRVDKLARTRRGRMPGSNAADLGASATAPAPADGSVLAGDQETGPLVEQGLLSLLPQDLQGGRGGTSAPQIASFIGLPGGVVFRSGSNPPVTVPTPAPSGAPATPPAPAPSGGQGTPSNPDGPVLTPTPTAPNNPADPVNPSDPTDPQPGIPGNPVLPPSPGPGAVPEPGTWALMILGIGFVGTSLRRRRRSALAATALYRIDERLSPA
ncbi:PEPxxWA-CTERM sorting domain-containing protein [Sphingomonas sp. S2-65]|uniref:PEPxxWA-CTERM sorting domain-containing protein n=1 Tax=Sphingomonas sp. S2-65 TaxID=2903960 RepID=UPI001F209C9E|nr:PEPxxWA-CTERM sorting domain-containing protein [Sphingomonas sp. S2-65]UYY57039.1 PEPxxWA-CTERM sorting domain-containing protein [Sphingomonas sp. S2-65]